MIKKTNKIYFLFGLLFVSLILTDLKTGSVAISWAEFFGSSDETVKLILNQRLLTLFVAILAGSFLSLSGLLLQVLFRNILAGPSVLGITSGSSFGVAFFTFLLNGLFMSGRLQGISLVVFSFVGSFFTLLLLVWASRKINSASTLLVIGLMLSFIYSALIDLLRFYFDKNQLQFFSVWNMASFNNCSWVDFTVLFITCLFGLGIALFTLKKLDIYALGDEMAQSMGINLKSFSLLILIASGIMVGAVTAYCGPIAFVGLAVPLLARLLGLSPFYKGNFFLVLLLGAMTAVLCNIISKNLVHSQLIPVNSISSLIGIPIVLYTLVKNKAID